MKWTHYIITLMERVHMKKRVVTHVEKWKWCGVVQVNNLRLVQGHLINEWTSGDAEEGSGEGQRACLIYLKHFIHADYQVSTTSRLICVSVCAKSFLRMHGIIMFSAQLSSLASWLFPRIRIRSEKTPKTGLRERINFLLYPTTSTLRCNQNNIRLYTAAAAKFYLETAATATWHEKCLDSL